MTRDTMQPYDISKMKFFAGVGHTESLSVGPQGEAYTCGFYTFDVYRLDLATNTGHVIASTAPRRILGQVVDGEGNIYCADCESPGSKIIRITPKGEHASYSMGPPGGFLSANTPAFDRDGNMYVSDTGTWSEKIDGRICKIPPGGGEAEVWSREPLDTPNGIALDAEERYLYFVETWGNSIARLAIEADGSCGAFERVLHMRRHIPDGIAFDKLGRLWIACHRPDSIYVFDVRTRRLELFTEDWQGALRGPCHVAFAGPERDVLLASSLDKATVCRFDNPGIRGLHLNNPVF